MAYKPTVFRIEICYTVDSRYANTVYVPFKAFLILKTPVNANSG